GSLLTLAAGFLFGLGYGFAIVSLASTLGATCAFLVGRFLARDWVAAKLQSQPRFSALDAAVGEQGAVVVLLTRLSPIFPFSLLNYGLGLTQVKLSHYVLASWAGMIPGTLLYVYLGSIASNLTSILAGDLAELPASNWLFYLGLGATLILTIAITRIATKALNSKLEGVSAGDSV
ncbi:MAG: TVP38/TMEM64 family protein, partial [Pseudomonadota bacterium]|nr:TVP38/TMEM64 family protein [Pseudomonadota bacterium]